MSDQENFLTRWSRRKRDVADAETPAAPEPGNPAGQGAVAAPSVVARAPEANLPVPEFDLTKLPSLDSIGANSDIRAFLQAGVPSALRHAALRRAWAADPAIRDFKGLAENDWDFTVSGGAPGFGELDPGYDIKKLVAEIFGEGEDASGAKGPTGSTISRSASEQPTPLAGSGGAVDGGATGEPSMIERRQLAALESDRLLRRESDIAVQQKKENDEPGTAPGRRHGSAMPQ